MGKRSTTSTKSGRAMNPADQARKEARRRELKKNKKQRQVVREAVIKSKDPKKVIEELERLDQMEYNIHEAPPLPDHVLSERRKRLLGNFNRCLGLYDKEDKTQYSDLKKMLSAYHRKHDEMRKYYDSVKRAQNVSIEDITLPGFPPEEDVAVVVESSAIPTRTPQGPVVIAAPRQLSWEIFSDDFSDTGGRRPPGPPCCPPPTLSDDSDEEIDAKKDSAEEAETDEEEEEDDEDDSADIKEDHEIDTREDVKETDYATKPLTSLERLPADSSQSKPDTRPSQPGQATRVPAPSRLPFVPPVIPGIPNFRNVPPPSLSSLRFPPPGNAALTRIMMLRPPPTFPSQNMGPIGPVRPAAGSETISHRPALYVQPTEQKATFVAKPQLRNTMAENTRLIPTAVKVRREEQVKPKPKSIGVLGPNVELIPHRPASSTAQQPKGGADQAYETFMKEMQGLL